MSGWDEETKARCVDHVRVLQALDNGSGEAADLLRALAEIERLKWIAINNAERLAEAEAERDELKASLDISTAALGVMTDREGELRAELVEMTEWRDNAVKEAAAHWGERNRLKDKIAQFIHGEDHPDQYVTKEEAGKLKGLLSRVIDCGRLPDDRLFLEIMEALK